jgi:putative Holliday junction resolvase
MKYLGIDYGKKKIGLAMSEGKLSEPYQVIRYADYEKMIFHIKRIVEKQKVENVVVGMSENEMGEEINRFVKTLRSILNPVPCTVHDETLSSYDAIEMSVASGMSRKKRKEMEDAFAASIMLQNYIDSIK